MRPRFEELFVNAKVKSCKKCKNAKYYIVLQNLETKKDFDIFSNIPYDIGSTYELELWKVIETKYYVK